MGRRTRRAPESDAGLPLAKFDTTWIADFVRARTEPLNMVYGDSMESLRRMNEDDEKESALFTDPEVFRSIVLRIKATPST